MAIHFLTKLEVSVTSRDKQQATAYHVAEIIEKCYHIFWLLNLYGYVLFIGYRKFPLSVPQSNVIFVLRFELKIATYFKSQGIVSF